jgi:hypothetical protein
VSGADIQAFAAQYMASRQPLVAISKAAPSGSGAIPNAKK